MTERAAARLPEPPDVLELDVNSEDDLAGLAREIDQRWGGLDGVLHAIAFAPRRRDRGEVPGDAGRERAGGLPDERVLLPGAGAPSGAADGAGDGSVVGLDFDASVAWPAYDWMGVSKAALEAVNRYLARDLGRRGIRANLISAGPIASPAAGGIPGFDGLSGSWPEVRARSAGTATTRRPSHAPVCFLLSDWSEAISGELIHVDGGAHAVAGVAPAQASSNGAAPQPIGSETGAQ